MPLFSFMHSEWTTIAINAVSNTSELALRCREESAKSPQQRALIYCFELFRRAIVEDDQAAWAAVHAQYIRLVHSWLGNVAGLDSQTPGDFRALQPGDAP